MWYWQVLLMLFRQLQSGLKLDDSNGHCALMDWWTSNWVWVLTFPMHLGLKIRPSVSHNVISVHGSPDTHLNEAKASHSQRMWDELSFSAPHLLHKGLLLRPIKWRCLLRVLCPVIRPVTTLDHILLKDKSLVFQFSSLSMSATKTLSPCQMLVIQPVN
jgi:hypothetical protein